MTIDSRVLYLLRWTRRNGSGSYGLYMLTEDRPGDVEVRQCKFYLCILDALFDAACNAESLARKYGADEISFEMPPEMPRETQVYVSKTINVPKTFEKGERKTTPQEFKIYYDEFRRLEPVEPIFKASFSLLNQVH